MTYQTEFPDFTLDFAVPAGFVDQSWRNDSCPCWVNDRRRLIFSADYADPAMREIPEGDRFMVMPVTDSNSVYGQFATIAEVNAFLNRLPQRPVTLAEFEAIYSEFTGKTVQMPSGAQRKES
jgi:hypothetical protein